MERCRIKTEEFHEAFRELKTRGEVRLYGLSL